MQEHAEAADTDTPVSQEISETGLSGLTLARLANTLDNIGSTQERLEDEFPTPLRFEAPTLPNSLKTLPADALSALHTQMLKYYQFVLCKDAEAGSDVRDVELKLKTQTYALRVELRAIGYNREEIKEQVEVEQNILRLNGFLANAKRRRDHLAALCRGADKAVRLLEEERFSRSRPPINPGTGRSRIPVPTRRR